MAQRPVGLVDLVLAPLGLLVALVVPVVIAASRPEEPISQYTVPKEATPPLPATPAPVSVERARTLAAIVPSGEKTWFFKVTGPVNPVADQMEKFLEFLGTVKFTEKGQPEWKLPEGWSEGARGGEMRFATVAIAGDPPLELSVLTLPGDGSKEEYILANVNRWRGQLSLKPVTAATLYNTESKTEETRPIDIDGRKVVLVNLVGFSKPDGMGGAPFAGGAARPSRPAPPAVAQAGTPTQGEAAGSGVKFKAPESWKPGKTSQFRKASFVATDAADAKRQAEITIIDLPAAGGGGELLANVNRWRGQVGLAPTTADELKAQSKEVEVAGDKGTMVELKGEKGDAKQTILGVMTVRGKTAWFIKLHGDASVADAEKERFEAFVKSVRFE